MQKPLVTQCPQCFTRFQLTLEQLRAADGIVRCGRCEAIFSAERHLETALDEPLPANEAEAPPAAALTSTNSPRLAASHESNQESALEDIIAAYLPATEETTEQQSEPGTRAQPASKEATGASAPPRGPRGNLDNLPPEPVLLIALPKKRSPWVNAFWTLAALAGLLAAVGQYAWFERDRLHSDPRLAPLYQQLCQQIDCRLRPAVDIARIQTHQLLVRDHPRYENALSVDLLLENRAAFAQPFPALKLIFESLDGAPTVARIIQPHQYLKGDFHAESQMPRNKTIQLHLEFEAPPQPSPAYRLDLVPAEHNSP